MPDSFSFVNHSIATIYAEAAPPDPEALMRARTPKALGELAELAFLYRAASLGFTVSKPLGDNEPFDFILNSGQRLWRVQVKSTYHLGKGGEYSLRATRASVGGRTRAYSPDSIDILAGWVMPLDTWYIIPVEAFAPRRTLAVYPHREPDAGQFECFREAWCQLACKEEGTTRNSLLIDWLCQPEDGARANENSYAECRLKKAVAQLRALSPKTIRII